MNLIVGQIWEVNAGSTRLQLLIGRINLQNGEAVASIRIENIPVPPATKKFLAGRDFTTCKHMPISVRALNPDLVKLLAEGQPVPIDFEEGYQIWRDAVESGKGGWFTTSLKQALSDMFETMAAQ
jgi:hypothetical protein